MGIELKPKKEKKKIQMPTSFDVLFYYSIILLLFSVSGYLLISQWNAEMQTQIQNREDVLQRLESQGDFQSNRDFVFEQRDLIEDYMAVLTERNLLDGLFIFLENSVHPLAHWDSVRVDLDSGELRLEGSIYDFYALEQQYTILKEFKMDRPVYGWISARDLDLDDDGEPFVPEGVNVSVFNTPSRLNQIEKTTIDSETDVDFLKKIEEMDYMFREDIADRSLIRGDWYEVVTGEEVEVIEEVIIRDISEIDDDLRISFNVDLQMNPLIFKQ